jgi:predicted metalloprotease with PDZ domain
MRALVARGRAGGGPLSSLELVAELGKEAGPEAEAALRAWAVDGVEPDLARGLALPGLRLVEAEVPTFDTGFDHEATLKDGLVRGVVAGGPAARAGLLDGMRLAGWSVTLGDAFREVEITVREGSGTRVIKYLPQGAPRRGLTMVRE